MTNLAQYESITLREELSIKDIYSIHYFEYSKDFIYEGESHDFWELLFVDFGSIEVTANTQTIPLKKGEMIFHKPNEFHALRACRIILSGYLQALPTEFPIWQNKKAETWKLRRNI